MREQRIALEHHAHAAFFRAQGSDVAALEQDAAMGGLHKAGDHLQGGGLAAAGGPEQGEELAAPDLQAQVFDGVEGTIGLGETV